MYEELVKRLKETTVNHDDKCESCPYEEDYPCCVDCLDEMHIEAADAIEEQDMCYRHLERDYKALCAYLPRWIPVTERLPECEWGAEVGNIEWISCGMVFAGCFGRGGKYRDAYFRTWTDVAEGIDAKDADYWRPIRIPEPPKEET